MRSLEHMRLFELTQFSNEIDKDVHMNDVKRSDEFRFFFGGS